MQNLIAKESTVTVPAESIRRVLPFAPPFDYRSGLMGVRVVPDKRGGVLVMACDGHSLLCTHAAAGKADRTVTLPFTTKRNKIGLAGADSVEVAPDGTVWTRKGNTPHFICTDGLETGKFPDVEGLIGDASEWSPGLSGTFSLSLLVGRVIGKGSITFYQHPGKQATLFIVDGGTFGLLMPMRGEPKGIADVVPMVFRKAVAA